MRERIETRLDSDELFHIAVADSRRGLHDQAIEHLKQSLALRPDDAKTVFMLAAEHAEIGMVNRSVAGMKKAISLDPALSIAHFQLGLVELLYRNDAAAARNAWAPLDRLSDASALVTFGSALLTLAEGNLAGCISGIDEGVRLNAANPALNREMLKIRDRLQQQLQGATTQPQTEATPLQASEKMVAETYQGATTEGVRK